MFQPRNTAARPEATVISGTGPIRYLATTEFSNSSGLRQGRIIAATRVPKNVTAMTSVASRMNVLNSAVYAYRALTTSDGTSIRISPQTGTWRFSLTCEARSGRIRSKAAAKITRVDDMNSVPAQPTNQAPKASRNRTRRNAVGIRNDT